jgi:hypothetical protein
MPSPADLPEYATSPGAAVAERASWENRLRRELEAAFEEEDDDITVLVASLSLPGWARAVERVAAKLHIPAWLINGLRLRPGNGTPAEEADRLAATLATQAYNVHVLELLSGAGVPTKRWVSRHDDQVRATHRVADGQEVPLFSPFLVGGFPLMYPADSTAAPIALWINCRCVAVAGSSPAP